jgi:predicted nucleotidyltransferase
MNAPTALSAPELQVLRALIRGGPAISGRAVARIAGLPTTTARRALAHLAESGLVLTEHVPPAIVYRANRDHLAMPALLSLTELDDQLRTRLAEQIAGWQVRPEALVVFGSIARGEASSGSDVDLLAIRPEGVDPDHRLWQEQLADLADRVGRWTGRPASVIEMNRGEARQGMADGEAFLLEADRDGWLIAGTALRNLAAGAS